MEDMATNPKVVGLTGGIATGKSTVTEMFAQRGACVIDADQIAREVVEPGRPSLQKIRDRFGDEVLFPDGKLDRPKLGEIVFNDPAAREDLNRIVHPAIFQMIEERIGQARERSYPLILVDVPLLLENNRQTTYDAIIVVYTPEEIQLDRLMKRDGMNEQQAKNRIAAQMSIEEKKKYADYIIDNSGTTEQTERQVEHLFAILTQPGV